MIDDHVFSILEHALRFVNQKVDMNNCDNNTKELLRNAYTNIGMI